MSEQRNLILAVVLSIAVLFGFNFFYEKPVQDIPEATVTKVAAPVEEQTKTLKPVTRSEALGGETPRIAIKTPKLSGSIHLKGARLDDLVLTTYREQATSDSEFVQLLSPEQATDAYYVDLGWHHATAAINSETLWRLKEGSPNTLTPSTPVILVAENQAFRIERTISIDENYLFAIQDRVTNMSTEVQKLQPQGSVTRVGTPATSGFFILHEGAVGVINHKLNEHDYAKLLKEKSIEQTTTGGWLGFTDKYWLVAFIPPQSEPVLTRFSGKSDAYTCAVFCQEKTLKPQETIEHTEHVFAGAKVLRLLDGYEEKLGFDRFDLAVDFGWFYFITKPLFYVLETLHQWLGNLGVAILILTVFVKLLMFPLANKSFHSMARMKTLQPQVERLKERYSNDKMKMNQELMALYQNEKVNPMAGCLPMVIQAPIFFCLYKVFFVTIEMRHAPFFGWIYDLSAPDPTSVFNLFGLLPFAVPSFLMIGALPLLMGATMVLQQRMNPQPADPAQAKVMMIMPIMFTYLFASFPAGLVLYWAWSNILTIIQQWWITRQAEQKVLTEKARKKR